MPRPPRPQAVIFPYLRQELPNINFYSWMPDVDYRTMPIVKIRRMQGRPRGSITLDWVDRPILEITSYSDQGLVAAEENLLDARFVIFRMWRDQIVMPEGHLNSFYETMGPAQFDSDIEDSWRIQCLIQVGIRPPRE